MHAWCCELYFNLIILRNIKHLCDIIIDFLLRIISIFPRINYVLKIVCLYHERQGDFLLVSYYSCKVTQKHLWVQQHAGIPVACSSVCGGARRCSTVSCTLGSAHTRGPAPLRPARRPDREPLAPSWPPPRRSSRTRRHVLAGPDPPVPPARGTV